MLLCDSLYEETISLHGPMHIYSLHDRHIEIYNTDEHLHNHHIFVNGSFKTLYKKDIKNVQCIYLPC